MARLILLLALLLPSLAQARSVLLISLHSYKQERSLQRSFEREWRRNRLSTLETITHATQAELFRSLQDPTVESVFWFSHGLSGPAPVANAGSVILPKIVDHRGDNVAPVFALAGSQLKFLGVVGCNSENILNHYGLRADLLAQSYISQPKKVIGQFQIRKVIKAFKEITPTEVSSEEEKLVQGHLRIERSIPSSAVASQLRSLRLYVGNKLISVLPAPAVGESANSLIAIPAGLSLKVKLESGENMGTTANDLQRLGEWGEIRISSEDLPGEWTLFTDATGKPLGVNQRIFTYRP